MERCTARTFLELQTKLKRQILYIIYIFYISYISYTFYISESFIWGHLHLHLVGLWISVDRWLLHNLLHRADETQQGRNSCPRLQLLAFSLDSILSLHHCFLVFIWARSTGLARFPRSRRLAAIATLFFVPRQPGLSYEHIDFLQGKEWRGEISETEPVRLPGSYEEAFAHPAGQQIITGAGRSSSHPPTKG